MTAGNLWLRLAASMALAVGLLLGVAPAGPPPRLPWLPAAGAGTAAGVVLYMLALRSRPLLPGRGCSVPLVAAKQCLLGLWAASEEVVWRRVLLGELLFAGAAAALCGSTLAFALAHRRRGLHLGTGAAFGGLYLASGILAASIAAHWTYNALVGARLERARSS